MADEVTLRLLKNPVKNVHMSDESQKKTPSQMGQYYLMEKIAQGGMAEIFKGLSYDVHGIKKTVCIKKILPHIIASHEFIDSLIDEAKIAVKLIHGNIAQTYDLGKVADDYFMVMEYVDGKSLSQINKRCQQKGDVIPVQYLVYFISEILSGLDYIHRRTDESGVPLHIVHRDMSPQNIMVSYSGTVKIIDFGIAKAGVKVGATESGILKGKFAYMSPEQAYGDEIDHRSDIFSVGIMLHEMLTGRRLFKGTDSRETIRNVRKSKVDAPSAINPSLPEELDVITMKALAKDRRHRYSSASDMRDALLKFLHTSFPEFKASDASVFVQKLFSEDYSSVERSEVDSKTPYLIIDRSNSALLNDSQFEITGAAKAPIDMRDYMIDEESKKEKSSELVSEEITAERAAELTGEEKTQSKPEKNHTENPLQAKIARNAVYIAIAIAGIAFALFLYSRAKVEVPSNTETVALSEIMVVTEPSDARIHLDGVEVGSGSPVTIRNITPEKEHTLEVKKDGYIDHKRTVNLTPAEFLSLSIKLEAKAPNLAAIEIVSEPAGATVYINDKETSLKTPVKIPKIDPRQEHSIGLFLKGYKFWTKKIKLNAGESRSFDINLDVDYASALFDSHPSEALIIIDGQPSGQTPLTKEGLSPQKIYKIEVWKDGYLPEEKEVMFEAGKRSEIRFTLTKSPAPQEEPAKTQTENPPPATTEENKNAAEKAEK